MNSAIEILERQLARMTKNDGADEYEQNSIAQTKKALDEAARAYSDALARSVEHKKKIRDLQAAIDRLRGTPSSAGADAGMSFLQGFH